MLSKNLCEAGFTKHLVFVFVVLLAPSSEGRRRGRVNHTPRTQTIADIPTWASEIRDACWTPPFFQRRNSLISLLSDDSFRQRRDAEHVPDFETSDSSGATGQPGPDTTRRARERIQNAFLNVAEIVNEVAGSLGADECIGLNLDSLSEIPVINTSSQFVPNLLNIYSFLTLARSHLFFMSGDWQSGPGIPCDGMNRALVVFKNIQRLERLFGDLLCFLKNQLMSLGVEEGQLSQLTEPSLRVEIYRYSACTSRKMRDCLVVSKVRQAVNMFNRNWSNHNSQQ